MDAEVADDLLDPVFGEVAVAAEQLQRVVGDLEQVSVTKRLAMAQKAVASGALASSLAQARQSKVRADFQLGPHVGQAELGVLEIGDGLAEGAALLDIGQRDVHRGLGAAERAGGDVQPAPIEPGHGEAEPLPFLTQQRRGRHAGASKITARVGWAFQPIFFSLAPNDRPGVAFGTSRAETPPGPSPPVRTMVR